MKNREIRDITSLMFKNKGSLLLMITFDVLFVLVLLALRFVQINLDNVLFPLFTGGASEIYSISYVVFELFLVILVYSFFKYFIVKFMQEGFKETKFKLKSFFSFLRLNLIIFIPLVIIVAVILDFIILFFNNWLSKGGIDPFMFVFVILGMAVLALILFIFVYTFINIVHFSFLKEKGIGKILKKGIISSFKWGSYKIYWSNFKIIFAAGIFLLIVHFLVKSFIFDDFQTYVRNVGNYKIFIYWVIGLVLYFLLLFNRFSSCRDASNVYKKMD